jgi:hypothetical protein
MLERDGIVIIPSLVSPSSLREMQEAFDSRLLYFQYNNVLGYQRNELMRILVEDVLTLSQGFVDIALHPIVLSILDVYIKKYNLCEAKGWQTQPAKKDFHGWHSDAWYDQKTVTNEIPREVKLAFYLSDVKSGALQYVKGSHRQRAPFHLKPQEVLAIRESEILECNAPAGTAILFDTSGIHRQSIPVIEPMRAVFYNYHDSSIPLQKEDVDYYRYHPLLLNAAFLGGISTRQQEILGFGDKRRLQLNHVRVPAFSKMHLAITNIHLAQLYLDHFYRRVWDKLEIILG